MDGLLKLANPPTAVCCYNDMTALGAMRAIRARGLRVPEDVSVTGFDDLFFAAYLRAAADDGAAADAAHGRDGDGEFVEADVGRRVGGAGQGGGGADCERVDGKGE